MYIMYNVCLCTIIYYFSRTVGIVVDFLKMNMPVLAETLVQCSLSYFAVSAILTTPTLHI